MSLLNKKDFDAAREALRRMEDFERIVQLGRVKARITTRRAKSPWSVAMIVRLETWRGELYVSQYFESVEQMEAAWIRSLENGCGRSGSGVGP